MLKHKWFAWLLMGIIGLLPVPAAVKYLQTFIVRNAVVTAVSYEVRAPIDGIVKNLNAGPGDAPGDGPVLILENQRFPLADINSLDAVYREKQKYHQTLEAELAGLEARMEQERDLLSDYLAAVKADLEQGLGILECRRQGEAARLKEVTQTRHRISLLVETAAAAQEDADRIEADFQEAKACLAATGFEVSRTRLRLKMLDDNLFPPDISDGVLQVQSRINALDLDIMDCRRRIHASSAAVSQAAAKTAALKTDLDTRSLRAAVRLPASAVIWDVDVTEGMEVGKGDRMLSYIDRNGLMVEAAVDDATLELIHPGHSVRIRIFGRSGFMNGTVVRVAGSAAGWPEDRYAARIKERSPRDGRVLVSLADDGLREDVRRLCGVGRTAYAEFEGIGLVEQYLGAFLR